LKFHGNTSQLAVAVGHRLFAIRQSPNAIRFAIRHAKSNGMRHWSLRWCKSSVDLGHFFFFLQNADGGDHTNGVDIDVMINRITANRIHEQLNNNLGR
jgi:hypothetical protein